LGEATRNTTGKKKTAIGGSNDRGAYQEYSAYKGVGSSRRTQE